MHVCLRVNIQKYVRVVCVCVCVSTHTQQKLTNIPSQSSYLPQALESHI